MAGLRAGADDGRRTEDPAATPGNPPATIVAFTSPATGIGRTGVVSNLAWVLASAGHRVGVADWGTEPPRVHDYLRPFLAGTLPSAELLGPRLAEALSARRGRTAPFVEARRYELPAGLGRIDVAAATDPGTPVPGFTPQPDGDVALLREAIRSTSYDYVLIDGPGDMTVEGVTRLARLCDAVAVCFPPRRGAIARAVEIAREVWDQASVGVRIVGVPVQVDDRDERLARRAREAIRESFGALPTERGADGRISSAELVEIPWQPHDAYEETLSALVDEPGGPAPAAYRRLAGAVVGADPGLPPEIPSKVRESYRRAVGLGESPVPERILLAYAAPDRPWADWVRDRLEAAGARVERFADSDDPEQASVLVLASPHLARSAAGRRVRRLVADGHPGDVAVLPVTEDEVAADFASLPRIPVDRRDEAATRARLLARFSLVDRPDGAPDAVRFPASRPARSNLAPRNRGFVGRAAEIEAIRDHFASSGEPWTLCGEAGIGKSELAREYAHRFAFDYDWVWWIPAHNRRAVRRGLVELASQLRAPVGVDSAEAALRVLSGPGRRLLVFDGADDPDVLSGLVPDGHVLVTTRAEAGKVLGRFRGEDSVTMLRRVVRDLSVEDARRVAGRVEHMPLALRLAAAWIREGVDLLSRYGNTRAESAAWSAAEYCARLDRAGGDPPTAAVAVLLDTLREEPVGRAAVRIGQVCSFLSAEGVALRLLRTRPVVEAAAQAAPEVARDSLELDRVLWRGAHFGLFDLDWRQPPTLRVHRVVQDLVGRLMSDGERAERQAEALRGLAAFAPSDAEDEPPERAADHAELQKHLVPSGALDSTDPVVRRWVVDQLRYLHTRGGPDAWRFAADLGHRLRESWSADGPDAALRLRLGFQLANLHRELGEHGEALRLDEEVLAEQRRVLGTTHPRTLKTARGLAAGYRALGRFDDAVAEDRSTLRGLRDSLGDDHPDTLRAANNLARSLFLVGNLPAALEVQEENRERRLALFGPDHPDVWWSAASVGNYLCELGRYPKALAVLKDALDRVLAIRPANHPDELRIQWLRAIALRRSGDAVAARDRNAETLRAYRALHGEQHPSTTACKLSYAADHHGTGDSATAARLGADCLDEYRRTLGAFHPFTLLCQVDQGIFLRGCGDVEQALALINEACGGLRARLGEAHPWTVAANLDHARALAAVGEVDAAVRAQREAYETGLEFLVRDHPYTQLAAGNLGLETDDWQEAVLDVPTV
ncbi:FxSxx-COOH system tetratricopeptide repeat protein [Saccharopolyspora rosea]|uniref:FxSxx-COOH system tetratricopeptide repeat protein n=1 Tax=Saccharopolyspora rosea TaxID=524884 RepID=A0ABW3FXL6_9PSEU